jgi:hypothetical protein
MDITKELEKMQKGNLYPHAIVEDINKEKEQLEKKGYIFQVLAIAKDIEDYISLKDFSICNIGGFGLDCCDHNDGTHSVAFYFYRPNGEIINHDNTMKKQYPEIVQRFREIFNGSNFDGLKDLEMKSKYLNDAFVQSGCVEIDLELGAGEEVLNALLSKELKTVLDYSRMQLDLENKSEPSKKLKV